MSTLLATSAGYALLAGLDDGCLWWGACVMMVACGGVLTAQLQMSRDMWRVFVIRSRDAMLRDADSWEKNERF